LPAGTLSSIASTFAARTQEVSGQGITPLVLLCPAWRRWGTAKPGIAIVHSEADDVIPIAENRELVRSSGLPDSALIVIGNDHRLTDPDPLRAMLEACESAVHRRKTGDV
jgi:hypothetical protein